MYWEYRLITVQPGVKKDLEYFEEILKENWEPYAVTWDGSSFDHHLRRRIYFQ